MTSIELKAKAFDLLVVIEQLQNELRQLNQSINEQLKLENESVKLQN
jgi:hypothetical protein